MVEGSLNHVPHVNELWKLQHSYKYEFKYISRRIIHRLAFPFFGSRYHISTMKREEVWEPNWPRFKSWLCHSSATIWRWYLPKSASSAPHPPLGQIENSKTCVQSTGNVCKAPRRRQGEPDDSWAWFIQDGGRSAQSEEVEEPAVEIQVISGLRKVVPWFPVKFCPLTKSRNWMRETTSTSGVILMAVECVGFSAMLEYIVGISGWVDTVKKTNTAYLSQEVQHLQKKEGHV